MGLRNWIVFGGLGVLSLMALGDLARMTKPAPAPSPAEAAEAAAEKARVEREMRRVYGALSVTRASMKNPKAFEVSRADLVPSTGAVCMAFHSTNSFNAVVPGRMVLTPSDELRDDDATWRKHCAGKEIVDYARVAKVLK